LKLIFLLFHGVIHKILSLDDANEKKKEIEQQQHIEKSHAQQGAPQDAV
jgi:hypothetical protein